MRMDLTGTMGLTDALVVAGWLDSAIGIEDSTGRKREDKDKIIKKTSMRKAKVEELQRRGAM